MPAVKQMSPQTSALQKVAERFGLSLRLAREMKADGYLRTSAVKPDYPLTMWDKRDERWQLIRIGSHYSLSREKILHLYNAGFLDLDGLDCDKAVTRFLQRHSGQLSVRLLSYVAYSELWPEEMKLKNQAAYDCLAALKLEGKLSPPKHLEPYLDAACRGGTSSLERVAQWARDLLDSTDRAHSWAFIGVRLALTEGHYDLWGRPIPQLRRLRRLGKLRRLLRTHPLLDGYVTRVAMPGQNRLYTHLFHRPGVYWDL